MAVFAKPFNLAQKLFKTIFLGKPNIFSAQDLNRYLDFLHGHQMLISNFLGSIRENWSISATITTSGSPFVDGGGNNVINSTVAITFSKDIPLSDAYVYARGVRFKIPTATINQSLVVAAGSTDRVAYVGLVAAKKLLSYGGTGTTEIADTFDFCGVRGTDFPGTIPSSDSEVYTNERLVVVTDLDDITLGTDEEFIGLIATVKYQTYYANTLSPSVHPVSATTSAGLTVLYNACKMTDLLAKIPSNNNMTSIKLFQTGGSVIEILAHFIDNYLTSQTKQDSRIDVVSNAISTVIDSQTTLSNRMSEIEAVINEKSILTVYKSATGDTDPPVIKHSRLGRVTLKNTGDKVSLLISAVVATPNATYKSRGGLYLMTFHQLSTPDVLSPNSTLVTIECISDIRKTLVSSANTSHQVINLYRIYNNSTDGAVFDIYASMFAIGQVTYMKELNKNITIVDPNEPPKVEYYNDSAIENTVTGNVYEYVAYQTYGDSKIVYNNYTESTPSITIGTSPVTLQTYTFSSNYNPKTLCKIHFMTNLWYQGEVASGHAQRSENVYTVELRKNGTAIRQFKLGSSVHVLSIGAIYLDDSAHWEAFNHEVYTEVSPSDVFSLVAYSNPNQGASVTGTIGCFRSSLTIINELD